MPHPADPKSSIEVHNAFTTERLNHFGSPLHLFGQLLQLVRGTEVAANGPWMTQESQKSISLGFPALHDLGVDRALALLQGFVGFLFPLGLVNFSRASVP